MSTTPSTEPFVSVLSTHRPSPAERYAAMSIEAKRELLRRWNSYQADPRPGRHDLTFDDAEIVVAIAEELSDFEERVRADEAAARPMYEVRADVVVFFPGAPDTFEAPRVTGPAKKSWGHCFTGATDEHVVALYERTNGKRVAIVVDRGE